MAAHHPTALLAGYALLLSTLASANGLTQQGSEVPSPLQKEPARLGIHTTGVSRPMADLKPEAVFAVQGSPDWSVVTKDSVWVTSSRANHVVQLLATTNQVGFIADEPRPCSGLVEAYGSIWSPSCGLHTIQRIEPSTGKGVASIAADPANSEGGITEGDGSVWIVVKPATLVRISPATNAIIARFALPSESENPLFADGFIWVSSFGHDALLKVDPASGKIISTTAVGPKPRFLTAGAGSIWTLNQGDGSISRVEEQTGEVTTIAAGVPGTGGEITFGNGFVWATMFDFPITQISPVTNSVVRQWGGAGGDGIRFGLGSIWLSNGQLQTVWRISPDQK